MSDNNDRGNPDWSVVRHTQEEIDRMTLEELGEFFDEMTRYEQANPGSV